jgi:hypothetical protein
MMRMLISSWMSNIRWPILVMLLSLSFSVMFATSRTFTSVHAKTRAAEQPRRAIPVLQLFWPDNATGILPDYVARGIHSSVVPITLLTWGPISDDSHALHSVDVQHDAEHDASRLRFESKYQPWGMEEPWE